MKQAIALSNDFNINLLKSMRLQYNGSNTDVEGSILLNRGAALR